MNIKKFDQFINESKDIKTRNSGLSFTQIKIKKITDDAYVGEFSFNYGGKLPNMVETSYGGNSEWNVIKKIEDFLGTKLEDDDYILED